MNYVQIVVRLVLFTFLLAIPQIASAEFDAATRLAMVGDYEGALKEYEKFLYEDPRHELAPLAALAAGNIHLEVRQDYDAAARMFDQVATDYRSTEWAPEAAARKGESLVALEKWSEAALAFKLALDLDTDHGHIQSGPWINDVTANAADCYHHLDNHQMVVATYKRALEGSPLPEVAATALFRMGEAYEATERPADAARSYVEVLEKAPCASGGIFAQVLAKRELIDQHVSFDWKAYELYNEAYQLAVNRDGESAMERSLEAQASTSNPALLECIEARIISLTGGTTGDFTETSRLVAAYLEKYPRGQLTSRMERYQSFWNSILEAEVQAVESPDDPNVLSGLGVLYFYAGANQKAIEVTERARQLDPDNAENYEILGYAYYYTDRMEDAVSQFDLYLEKSDEPEDPRFFSTAGTACMRLEQFDKAVGFFERQAEASSEDASAHSNLGDALYRAGRHSDALEACKKAVELNPNFPNPLLIMGHARKELGRKDEAVEAYERFLEMSPSGEPADEARAALEELRNG